VIEVGRSNRRILGGFVLSLGLGALGTGCQKVDIKSPLLIAKVCCPPTSHAHAIH